MVDGRMMWIGVAAAAILTSLHPQAHAAEFVIDPQHTTVEFEMRALGGAQRGEFTDVSGTVALDAGAESAQIDILIDARSVDLTNGAIEQVVRSAAMLDVAGHPQIAYRAGRVSYTGDTPSQIDGELTLRGVTLPLALAVTRYECTPADAGPQRCAIIAAASFKRSAFGMTRYRMLAQDEVRLAIRAEGVRKF